MPACAALRHRIIHSEVYSMILSRNRLPAQLIPIGLG
jgi:hypothetical protein